jgi:hypothetical protein
MMRCVGEPDDRDMDCLADRLRESIRQRRAELAAEEAAADAGGLPDLEAVRVVEEPASVSARPVVGPLITLWKRAVKRLAIAWYVRPMIGQQNDFNQAAGRRIAELAADVERLERRVRELEAESTDPRSR